MDDSTPLRSPLRYPGGKSRVAKLLCSYIPEHADYREIFVGGGAIFFRKPRVKRNWINDLHPGLHAFWRTVRDDVDAFIALCREQDTTDLRKTFQYWIDRRDLMEARGTDCLLGAFAEIAGNKNELVTAHARQCVFVARGGFEAASHGHEYGVSGGVAQRVVHGLEAVDIDEEHGTVMLVTYRRGHCLA